LLIKAEGQEISTAVEVAEILKNRMYPRLEIGNVSLGSRPFIDRKNFRYNNRNSKRNNRNERSEGNRNNRISNIEIKLQTKSIQ
jgi:DNA-binding protein